MGGYRSVMVDASTYQTLVSNLAETLAQKISREGDQIISAPNYTFADLFMLLRHARETYHLLYFINADDIRTTPGWRQEYTVVVLPLVRHIIDDLYNVTMILENPYLYGRKFRVSGYKNRLKRLDENIKRYALRLDFAPYLYKQRDLLLLDIRRFGFQEEEIRAAKRSESWKTLGTYLAREKNDPPDSPHQAFLRLFTYGNWRQYSAISHGTFEGLMEIGGFLSRDLHPHDQRPFLDDKVLDVRSEHLFRAALIVLCIATELQGVFRFRDANINKRTQEAWQALTLTFEGGELYRDRYELFMKEKGIIK